MLYKGFILRLKFTQIKVTYVSIIFSSEVLLVNLEPHTLQFHSAIHDIHYSKCPCKIFSRSNIFQGNHLLY